MIRALVLAAAIYVALIAQEFIPPVSFLGGAHLLLVPLLFVYGALWLPFPGMVALAVYTGLLSDLATLHATGEQVEIGLGWSILFYVLLGTILRQLQPPAAPVRWEFHCLASAAATSLLLLLQYLMVCLRRESFMLDGAVLWHILGPGLAALFLAPLAYFLLRWLPASSWDAGPPGRFAA
jgi:hypothetical protein